MTFPPVPPPDQLLAETNQIAQILGFDQIMPGIGTFIASFVYAMERVTIGDCKDCACESCVNLRTLHESMQNTFGGVNGTH